MTALEFLCAELRSGDDARAEAAAQRLPEFGAEGLDAARALLKDRDVDSQWWGIRALAGFTDTSAAVPDLLAALQDDSIELRQAAALAFCHQPHPQAVSGLAQALSDPDPMTSRLASNALAQLGVEAAPALLDVLKAGRPTARIEAARALAAIGDVRTIPGLMKALESDSALMQYWIGLGLDKMGAGMVYLKPE